MAASDSRRLIKRAPYRVTFTILNWTTGNPITGATGLAPKVSKDGGTATATAGSATEIATNSGVYYVDLTATEMDADQLLFTCSSTSANAVTAVKELLPDAASDSGVAQASGALTLTLALTATATDDLYIGQQVRIVRGTGAGQVRTITDYVGSSRVATLDRDWVTAPDATSVYLVGPDQAHSQGLDAVIRANTIRLAGDTTAANNLEALYTGGLIQGTVTDAAPTSQSFKGQTGLSATNDFYTYQLLIFTSGALAGTAERISAYTGATRLLTLGNAMPVAPANGDTFIILGKVR